MENPKENIRQYIVQASMADSKDIKDDTLIFGQGYLDSMGLLFLVQFLNEEYKVATNDKDLVSENFESINAIASFLRSRLDISVNQVEEREELQQD